MNTHIMNIVSIFATVNILAISAKNYDTNTINA